MKKTAAVVTVFTILLVAAVSVGRQMCLSCQYVDNPKQDGLECATAPWNWTYGNTRMRCPFRCTISAQFSLKTGEPTFFHRGCSVSGEVSEKEECTDDAVTEVCSFTCVNQDYCNNRTFSIAPSMDDANAADGLRCPLCLVWLLVLFLRTF